MGSLMMKNITQQKSIVGSFSFQFRLRTQWVSFRSQKVQQKFQNELVFRGVYVYIYIGNVNFSRGKYRVNNI